MVRVCFGRCRTWVGFVMEYGQMRIWISFLLNAKSAFHSNGNLLELSLCNIHFA